MNVLVTGVKGQLGYDVLLQLQLQGIQAIGVDRDEFDLTKEEEVAQFVEKMKPTHIIHCAAYTAVDRCEAEKELAYNVNVLGTHYLAQAAAVIDAKFFYISTDYVFDGQGEHFYQEKDACHPINAYGESKYQGELEVMKCLSKYFILRISWVFGENGNNFVKTMLRLAQSNKTLKVVADQIGSPTYCHDLAILIGQMLDSEKYGIYHATNSGICSWYEFACEIMKQAKIEVEVLPLTTDQYPSIAKRPNNSRMSKQKLIEAGFTPLPDWKDALQRYLANINK